MAGVVSRGRALTGKLVAACRYWTHCLTQVHMRLCPERVPHEQRKWRLIHSLVEDGIVEAESEEEVAVSDTEEEETESEEDWDLMNETVSWCDSEEELDWEGL